jgi:hypothetical protein
LTETQPINFIDGKDTIGTPGGTTSNDMFSNINLPAGFCGMNNNFGELGLTPAYATKRSLLFPAQPVNLVAVNPTTAPPVNSGYSVPAAVTAPTTSNNSSTSPAKQAAIATTSTATVRALLMPPKTTTTHH